MVIEVLGDKIRNNNILQGIFPNRPEDKGAKYADDLWLLLLANEQNLSEITKFSGLKNNYHKTEILRIGNTPDISEKLNSHAPLHWSQ